MTVVSMIPTTQDTPKGLCEAHPPKHRSIPSSDTLWANAERQLHQLMHTAPEVEGPGVVAILTPFGMARSQIRWRAREHAWYIRIHAPFFYSIRRVVDRPTQAVADAWQEIGRAYTAHYIHARNRGATVSAECWAGAARQAFLASAAAMNP